jgi:hypothetical protein
MSPDTVAVGLAVPLRGILSGALAELVSNCNLEERATDPVSDVIVSVDIDIFPAVIPVTEGLLTSDTVTSPVPLSAPVDEREMLVPAINFLISALPAIVVLMSSRQMPSSIICSERACVLGIYQPL